MRSYLFLEFDGTNLVRFRETGDPTPAPYGGRGMHFVGPLVAAEKAPLGYGERNRALEALNGALAAWRGENRSANATEAPLDRLERKYLLVSERAMAEDEEGEEESYAAEAEEEESSAAEAEELRTIPALRDKRTPRPTPREQAKPRARR